MPVLLFLKNMEQKFKANSLIHFGTHGSEFALPGKPSGLSSYDWPDIIMGAMPDVFNFFGQHTKPEPK